MQPSIDTVYLYDAPATALEIDEVADWLGNIVSSEIVVRDRFFDLYRDDSLAEDLALTRVLSPFKKEVGSDMLGVVRYEERALDDPSRVGGVIYDGIGVQRLMNKRIPSSELSSSELHVPFLGRVIGTWGDHDGRWHKRINVLGNPVVVSIPGLYEAPAKPEEYYKLKQSHSLMSGSAPPREVLESEVEGDFLLEDDPRTTDAVKGYVLMGFGYWINGEGFCSEEECRLFNAHRQIELVESQLREPEFCESHRDIYS